MHDNELVIMNFELEPTERSASMLTEIVTVLSVLQH